ncbi:hypothetical protein V5F59_01465 [Xanthobacter autotrophicus DSM 431]|uniref:hypothetical protein n=1 Tax=Xanthobacter nonsaccharivorans TaxID=3119912 RepID=UPI0037279866
MTVYESKLTDANLKFSHIYITSFYRKLPPDVFGGTNARAPARRLMHLEFRTGHIDTFVPTHASGRPRTFFQNRTFVREFFKHTGAEPGDVVRFEQVTPYHLRLSLRTTAGRVIAA